MEDYDQKEDEIIDFYQDGFVLYRPLDKVDEQTFLGLVQAKRSIIQKK